jgi:hypothetical protein
MMIGYDDMDITMSFYIFRIIFSAANFASTSDEKSSGVTMLDVVLP